MRSFAMKTLISTAALALFSIGSAVAQTYPSRPITIIAPFPPGGPSDALARILSGPLEAALGQPIVIEKSAAPAAQLASLASRAPSRTAIPC